MNNPRLPTPSDSDPDSSIEIIPEPGQSLRDFMVEDAGKSFREMDEKRILESFEVVPPITKDNYGKL